MTREEIEPLYNEFWNTQSPWRFYVCDGCGRCYTHPGNYCYKCTGRLNQTRMTWGEFILLQRKNDRMVSAEERQLYDSLKERGVTIEDYKRFQDICYEIVWEKIKEAEGRTV